MIIIVALIAVLWSAYAWADTVTLGWDQNYETNLTQYNIYTRTDPSVSYPVTPTAIVPFDANISPGDEVQGVVETASGVTTYFVVTAADVAGHESGYSNEIQYPEEDPPPLDTIPPPVPTDIDIRVISVEVPENISLVVGDPGSLVARSDIAIRDHLQSAGYHVEIKGEGDTTWDPSTFDAVVTSESCFTGSLAWLNTANVGIVLMEAYSNDEFNLATTPVDGIVSTDVQVMNVHYITQGYAVGDMVSINSSQAIEAMLGLEPDVVPLANTGIGTWLLATDRVEGRRVFIGAFYFSDLNDSGKMFFQRSVEWVMEQ